MATAGLVGGLGPESTIDYYRRILQAWEREDSSTAPSLVIDSLDVKRALHLVATDRSGLTEYLVASLNRLARAGADFIAMTANTPHIVFDELVARSPVPMLSTVPPIWYASSGAAEFSPPGALLIASVSGSERYSTPAGERYCTDPAAGCGVSGADPRLIAAPMINGNRALMPRDITWVPLRPTRPLAKQVVDCLRLKP